MKSVSVRSYSADINVLHIAAKNISYEGWYLTSKTVTTMKWARSSSWLTPTDTITIHDNGELETKAAYRLGCPHCDTDLSPKVTEDVYALITKEAMGSNAALRKKLTSYILSSVGVVALIFVNLYIPSLMLIWGYLGESASAAVVFIAAVPVAAAVAIAARVLFVRLMIRQHDVLLRLPTVLRKAQMDLITSDGVSVAICVSRVGIESRFQHEISMRNSKSKMSNKGNDSTPSPLSLGPAD